MGIMSVLLGSGKTTTKQTPWGPQGDQLKNAFGQAQDLFNSKKGTSWYGGPLYAGLDPFTQQGITGTNDYATGAGQAAANSVQNSGLGMLGAGNQGMDAYGRLAGMASQDPTGANINSAGQYANNPYMDGMIDAASRDVRRNLTENTLPGVDRDAAATGNINSSRAGIAQGIAMRGAQDQMGDIASNMRGQAYQSGLGLAENARTANMGALGQAGSGLGGMYGLGLGAVGQGNSMNYGNLNAQIAAGQLNQQDAQGQMNADLQRWQGNDTRDQGLLQNYYNIIGANNWGGTTTTTQPRPGLLQTGLGLASAFAGMGGVPGIGSLLGGGK
jgi:hypothetical protein